MVEMILILLAVAVVAAIIIICAFKEPVEPRCIYCDKLTIPAPCGAMLCEKCCDRCNDMREKPCRYRKHESMMDGQEWE
jgi:hypothetical protein